MSEESFVGNRAASLQYSTRGLCNTFIEKDNAMRLIYMIGFPMLATLWICFKISFAEGIVAFYAFSIAFVVEGFNSIIELLCDKMHPEQDETIRIIKDKSAGFALWTSVTSMLIFVTLFVKNVIMGNWRWT